MTNLRQGRFSRIILAGAAIVFAGVASADIDLTRLPPDPAEVCGVLNNCSFSIIEAAIKAEKETGGRLNSIVCPRSTLESNFVPSISHPV